MNQDGEVAQGDARADSQAHTSIAEMVRRDMDRLTPTERKPARLLLSDYPIAGLETLAGFAEHAGVSHPSILRFIAKLGFHGYAEFQAALRAELQARLESPLTKHQESANEDFLDSFAQAACDNIRRSVAALPRREFEAALQLLGTDRNSLYLLGGRFTDRVASYAYMHLRVLRPRVQHVSGPPVSWPEYVVDMDHHTVLLIFDIRRYEEDLLRFAQAAAERGAQVVLLTDQWLSPIAGMAHHVLPARIEVPSSWDSVAALTMLVEALIAALNNRQWSHLKERLAELERMRGRFEGSEQSPWTSNDCNGSSGQ